MTAYACWTHRVTTWSRRVEAALSTGTGRSTQTRLPAQQPRPYRRFQRGASRAGCAEVARSGASPGAGAVGPARCRPHILVDEGRGTHDTEPTGRSGPALRSPGPRAL